MNILAKTIHVLYIYPSDESATIRVTNLSEDTRESDLQELFRPFGTIQRIYLAKDKVTGQSKVSLFEYIYTHNTIQRPGKQQQQQKRRRKNYGTG